MNKNEIEKRYDIVERSVANGVLLYGAGVNGEWCLDYLERSGIKVIAFIDSNPQIIGNMIGDIPIISYEQYREEYSLYSVLVSSKHHSQEILNNYSDNELMISFDTWLIIKHLNDYKKLEFVDQKSYEVLKAIMDCMYYSDESLLRTVAEDNQYFPFAPFFNTGNEMYVDLGAYTGDTIERFLFAQNGGFRKIYAFEPGKLQWKALNKRVDRLVDEWALDRDNIILINGGVGKKTEKCHISQSESLLSMKVTSGKGDEIAIYSLDDYLKECSFIKADIEGMEYDTLLGAEKLIKRCKPKMALSVYHKPDDLIRIFQLLSSWNPKYRFALRHHSSLLMDTTLYCW